MHVHWMPETGTGIDHPESSILTDVLLGKSREWGLSGGQPNQEEEKSHAQSLCVKKECEEEGKKDEKR